MADRKTLDVRKMRKTNRKDKKKWLRGFQGVVETLNGQKVLPDNY